MTIKNVHPARLDRYHPVAEVAARHCAEHLGKLRRHEIGETACGACWELAIRDDERAAIEFGLPREVVPDLSYVDEVAVERACRGEKVTLTRVEQAVVAERMRLQAARLVAVEARTITPTEARRLRGVRRSATDWKGRPRTAPKSARTAVAGPAAGSVGDRESVA